MSQVAEKAMGHLEKITKNGEPIATKKFFQGYALDTICRCAFGIDTNAHENTDHALIKNGRALFQGFVVKNWMDTLGTMLFYLFPGIESVSIQKDITMTNLLLIFHVLDFPYNTISKRVL